MASQSHVLPRIPAVRPWRAAALRLCRAMTSLRSGARCFLTLRCLPPGSSACSSCHDPKYAYGPAPGRAIPRGGPHMNLPGTRAVPSLRYLQNVPPFAEQYRFIDGDVGPGGGYTWDGRASSLQDQAQLPLLAANEMANGSPGVVVKRLSRTTYAREFRKAFGEGIFDHPREAFAAAVAALEAFQHVPAEFFPYSSKYDAFLRGDADLSESEERGAAIFKDPAKGKLRELSSEQHSQWRFPNILGLRLHERRCTA